MIAHKHIAKIVSALMAFLLCLCLTAMVFSDFLIEAAGGTGVAVEYERILFDTDAPITVNIIMEDAQWDEMLKNAAGEQYYQCDVEIGGQTFYRVGIRPKGNTSLSAIVSDPTTDRFSLKLEFDHYIEGQTCFGLDKLILNNNYADATNMKEALVYDMYQFLGADASLYNYAKVERNGEYWGVYLALEAVEDSFLLRNYGVSSGKLYKPDSMEMGNRGGKDFKPGEIGLGNFTPPDPANGETDAFPGRPQFGDEMPKRDAAQFGGADRRGGMADFNISPEAGAFSPPAMGDSSVRASSGGADLNYIDDALESYSAIWDGEVTNTGQSDRQRVVTALKNISEGTSPERYLDVDNLLKYMAVHVFSVNQDSLSGNMAHNYYLYESNGRLNLLPWDYNLSFGGMNGANASDVVNDAIDTPWRGTKFFDALMSNEAYLARYHSYLRQLVEQYVDGEGFDQFYEHTRSRIDSLVESDPTAFYSFEEYTAAAQMLYDVVKLRGQSISGQLDGSIPSTDSGQRENPASLIDTSSLNLSVMGSMNMGGGFARQEGEQFAAFAPDIPVNDGMQPQRPSGGNSAAAAGNWIGGGICLAITIAAFAFALFYRRGSRRR